MAGRGRPSGNKRERERAKQRKREEKELRRKERKELVDGGLLPPEPDNADAYLNGGDSPPPRSAEESEAKDQEGPGAS